MGGIEIHPTACVENGARLGKNVKIGPFCHLGAKVILGDECIVMSHTSIIGMTQIGARTVIYPHAVLGADPQNKTHKGGKTQLEIGKDCIIREGVTMHRGSDNSLGKTIVGNNCMFLAYSHVAHDCVIGNHVTFANNAMVGGHVVIGDHASIGGGGAVHQFVRVGHHAFVGGLAALVGDLIPYGMAIGVHAKLGGLNIIGMKRSGLKRSEIHILRHAIAMLFDRSKFLKERQEDVLAAYPDSETIYELILFMKSRKRRAFCLPEIRQAPKNFPFPPKKNALSSLS